MEQPATTYNQDAILAFLDRFNKPPDRTTCTFTH